MKHFAMVLAAAVVCSAGLAQAQTAPSADRAYVEVTGGPTFGHSSGGSIGAEGGYWLTNAIGLFGEAGWMSNVATSTMHDDAQLIASVIGGSADPKSKATYFDAGLAFRFPMRGHRMQPYVALGFGAARVKNETKFTVNGNDVTGSMGDYGVLLGTDLSGTYTKAFVTVGGGVRIPFGARWLGDISYRYGWIGKDTTDNADIAAINTNRLQFGFGARF